MVKYIFCILFGIFLIWGCNLVPDKELQEFRTEAGTTTIQSHNKSQSYRSYKRQNKLFHFHKTFCSEFDIINTKQNVHFTKVVSPIYQFCLSLHQFSIGAKAPFIIKEINTTASS